MRFRFSKYRYVKRRKIVTSARFLVLQIITMHEYLQRIAAALVRGSFHK